MDLRPLFCDVASAGSRIARVRDRHSLAQYGARVSALSSTYIPASLNNGCASAIQLLVIALDQKDAFYLVAVEALRCPANADRNVSGAHGKKVTVEHGAIAQLDCVVCGGAQFVTDTAPRSVVWRDLDWKGSCVEALFTEFDFVFPKTVSWTILGISPTSVPSTLKVAPWGTELMVRETFLAGAMGPSSGVKDRAASEIETG